MGIQSKSGLSRPSSYRIIAHTSIDARAHQLMHHQYLGLYGLYNFRISTVPTNVMMAFRLVKELEQLDFKWRKFKFCTKITPTNTQKGGAHYSGRGLGPKNGPRGVHRGRWS